MINNAPTNQLKKNGQRKYKQGNFIPDNKDKVIKLNDKGGVYYRSGYEFKIYRYLDLNPDVTTWGAEFIEIPYEKISMKKTDWGEMQQKKTSHKYYPDVYYELKKSDGTISKVLAEIKPYAETKAPVMKQNANAKQLTNFEYSMNLWNANMFKWEKAIEYCKSREIKFIIISEKYINMLKN